MKFRTHFRRSTQETSALILATVALLSSAACSSEAPPFVDDGRLRLAFEAIEHPLTSFSLFTDFAFFPDGSGEFLVCDRDGDFAHMRLSGDEAEVLMQGQLADIYVELAGATGILGLAVDPDIGENGFFYLAMTLSRSRVAVRRYTLHPSDPEATVASEVTILDIDAPGAPRWHNIMSMGFEEDGVMWIMLGDKGLFTPAQDPGDMLGSLVRILPSKEEGVGGYTTPADAPLYSPSADPSVYAIGLRSPWRGIYHEGRWFYGEVGGDDIEEINVIDRPGMNLGWPQLEGPCELNVLGTGPHDCSLYDDPWDYYGRSNSEQFVADDRQAVPTTSRSVYVGWIYKPNDNDPYEGRFDNVVTFGDTYVGFIRGRSIDGSESSWHVGHLQWASAWDQGPDGYVYVTALGDWPPLEDETARAKARLYRAVLYKGD